MASPAATSFLPVWQARFLLTMVLAIATAGLVYELGMGAVASYVLGDSVRQFSLVIGAYLSALGLGAFLSRYVDKELATTFVNVELSAALVGGLSSPALFMAFSLGASFQLLLLVIVASVGTLVGIELPLLMRILESRLSFKDLVARSLTYDYAGALIGSLAFSLYLVPRLGLVRTSIVCGLVNASVGLAATWVLFPSGERQRSRLAQLRWSGLGVLVVLLAALLYAPAGVTWAESRTYGRAQRAVDSQYQRLLLTERDHHLELYLNGHLQFSSQDECRYHEALVHPTLGLSPHPRRVLIGGGGDGLALREVLKWPSIERVVLVDLDPEMTALAARQPGLVALNRHSLSDQRVDVQNADAFQWVSHGNERYDAVILDFPDPTSLGVGKLFTTTFYRRLKNVLAPDAVVVVQATSPLLSPNSFWSIEHTLASVGYHTRPLRVFVPSFGDWGFVVAKLGQLPTEPSVPQSVELHCLDRRGLAWLSEFPADTRPTQISVNRLDNQSLVSTYLEEAQRLD
ncbi:MAG TPA: polyamine aminopropyltransferase [Polyangiaceae bacterium]|nr:polyamine aminopropyltransferase [Polyangiaceae bacterium]